MTSQVPTTTPSQQSSGSKAAIAVVIALAIGADVVFVLIQRRATPWSQASALGRLAPRAAVAPAAAIVRRRFVPAGRAPRSLGVVEQAACPCAQPR